jgi:hypothetical protein
MTCKLRCLALATAVALTLASFCACGEGTAGPPTAAPFATPTPVGIETPASGSIYLGAYVALNSPAGFIPALEQQIGRKFAMNVHYYDWASLFPGPAESGDLVNGRLPLDSWDCEFSDADIVSGAEDPLIIARAQAIKNFGHPVFLRYMWDMNLPAASLNRTQCYDPTTDNADTTFSATEYVAAWQHIRAIFAAQNVTNVVWVWNVSSAGVNPAPYYPGSSQVDWIGIDAFDTTGNGFASTVGTTYAQLASYGKPILVLAAESQPEQVSQFQGAVSLLKTQFPQIDAFLYYDGNSGNYFWALNQAGTAAFQSMASNPYFSAYGSL